jgi:hypothetical protein
MPGSPHGPGPGRDGRHDRRLQGNRAHTGYMGRIIGAVIGAILAIWLAVTVAGGIFATDYANAFS